MGDRCHMVVYCLKKDAAVFEDLGFVLQDDGSSPSCSVDIPVGVVTMVDEEANYAHSGDMPENIVYLSDHSRGFDYGCGGVVCDGKKCIEYETLDIGDWPAVPLRRGGDFDPDYLGRQRAATSMVSGVMSTLGFGDDEDAEVADATP